MRSGEIDPVQACQEALGRAQAAGKECNAFLDLVPDHALRLAHERRQDLSKGQAVGALFGVPIALKSNLCWQAARTSCGSRALEHWRSPYDATVVQRLLDSGAVPIGVTNMDEFAMGSSGENSAFGPTLNPLDHGRAPGGSSSGSAAAVAAGIVPLALGSDTGGSVRQPAALCGLAAFKPTWGLVSRFGLVAFASSLDVIGPLARSVRDLELALEVIAGADPADATCLDLPAPVRQENFQWKGARLGVVSQQRGLSSPATSQAIESALERARAAGAQVREVSIPEIAQALAPYYVISSAEAASNLARYDGLRYGLCVPARERTSAVAATRGAAFGSEVQRRMLIGSFALSVGYHDEWYTKAVRARARLAQAFARSFGEVDFLISPTSPSTAFSLGELHADPLAMYKADLLTVPASLAGLPAASIPSGWERGAARAALPIGMQIVGPSGKDASVLALARAFEGLLEDCVGRAGASRQQERP